MTIIGGLGVCVATVLGIVTVVVAAGIYVHLYPWCDDCGKQVPWDDLKEVDDGDYVYQDCFVELSLNIKNKENVFISCIN